MTMEEEQLKSALTPPSPGLVPVAPGVYVSKRSVTEIIEGLEHAGRLEPTAPPAVLEPPGDR